MVDRDEEPSSPDATGGLSVEEADRLSERYRPSWEVTDDEAIKAENRKLAKRTLIGIQPLPANGVASPPEVEIPVSEVEPATAVSPSAPSGIEEPPVPPVPPLPAEVSAPRPAATSPVAVAAKRDEPPPPPPPPPPPLPKTERAVAVAAKKDEPPPPPPPPPPAGRPGAVTAKQKDPPAPPKEEQVPESTRSPSSNPRGIVAPYQPKDDPSGPAVVLGDDVRAIEEAKAADENRRREQEVKTRRAPTVMNLKAPDIAEFPPPGARSKSSGIWWVAGIGLVVALVIVVGLNITQTPHSEVDAEPARAAQPASTTQQAPAEAAPRAEPPPQPAESARADVEGAAATAPEPASETKAPKRTTSGQPAKRIQPKPAPRPTAKPTSRAAPKKAGVIVRDTPF